MHDVEEARGAAEIEKQLEKWLRRESLDGGGTLPSEERLADYFNVTRPTVRLALHRLAARGLVVLHPGRRAHLVNLLQSATLDSVSLLIGQGPSLAPTQVSHLEALLELRRLAVMEALTRVLLEGNHDARSEVLGEVLLLNEAVRFRRDARKALRAELDVWLTLASASGSLALQLLMRTLAGPVWHAAPLLVPALSLEACGAWVTALFDLLHRPDVPSARATFAPLLAASDARALEHLSSSGEH